MPESRQSRRERVIELLRPFDSDEWLAALQSVHSDLACDPSLAATIRIAAGSKSNAVCLCSGTASLPYAVWLRDGMAMTARLIIHLDPANKEFATVVQQQLDSDIRLASHYQEISSFCDDIARHRLDLVVVDLNDRNRRHCAHLLSLLSDNGLMIVVADENVQERLHAELSNDYFFAPTGANQQAMMLSRKGMQHRVTRRSARRKR